MKLNYNQINLNLGEQSYEEAFLTPQIYNVPSFYNNPRFKDDFLDLKTNVADFDKSFILRAIKGTEQDFIMLMNKAKEYLETTALGKEASKIILKMFKDCIFGYYVLMPLINDEEVSDIDVDSWNHITCKKNGIRYITNITFMNEDDYNDWFKRILAINKLKTGEGKSLQHVADLKGAENFRLRLDVELRHVTSKGNDRMHIRKFPKKKYTWDYLFKKGMLDEGCFEYLKNRIAAGYSFLLSGEGGSGKSTLLNNMIDLIPYSKKVLVTQETDELYTEKHPQMIFEHTLEIENGTQQIEYTLEDELRQGLLQDINTFVIGEIKGKEALHCFITAMNTGANFYGTIHSNSAYSSIDRLAFCARLGSNYSVETLHEMMSETPFSLIHLSYFKIDEIVETCGWDPINKKLKSSVVYSRAR